MINAAFIQVAQEISRTIIVVMIDSKRVRPLERTAEVMTEDRDLWVVPRYEKLHLINILSLQRQLAALEARVIATANCEGHMEYGNGCPASCTPQADPLPELQKVLRAYGTSADSFHETRLI